MTAGQKAEVQRQIDRQLIRKSGGHQVSATQVTYDNGAVVLTFPVPGDAGQSDRTCDYGYVCLWSAADFAGRKLSLLSTAKSRPVNLSDYGMSAQVASWQHNKAHSVKIFGVDGPEARGNMVMSNIREVILGNGCCPFSLPDDVRIIDTWTEIKAQNRLTEYNARVVSIAFAPMYMLFAQ